MLDRVDKKILTVLGQDARLSARQVGKIVGTSRDVVRYRIRRMEEQGVIADYIPHVRNRIFGIDNYTLLISLREYDGAFERRILDKIASFAHVRYLVSTHGDYDVICRIGVKNKIHLADLVSKISNACGKHLQSLDVGIYIKMLKSEEYGYLLDDFSYARDKVRSRREEVDRLDRRIISLLCEEAQMSAVQIAPKVGLSAVQVGKRIKSLERDGIITNTQSVVDLRKIGYQQYMLYLKLQRYRHTDELRLREWLRGKGNIPHVERMLGRWDLGISIVVESQEQFMERLGEIRSYLKESLSTYAFCLVKETVKRKTYIGK